MGWPGYGYPYGYGDPDAGYYGGGYDPGYGYESRGLCPTPGDRDSASRNRSQRVDRRSRRLLRDAGENVRSYSTG